jgi:DNA-binding LytR/AlgR family response regulator
MKRVNVRFEAERGRRDIDILFRASEEDEQVAGLMERVADPLAGILTVSDAGGSAVSLPEERIITLSADNKRLRIKADDGFYWLKTSLQEAERILNPSWFLRISRYEIVNLRKVRQFDFSVSGALRIEMEDGAEAWASRRFIPIIRKRLQRKDR